MTILGLLDRLLSLRPIKASQGGAVDADEERARIAAILGAPGADANRAFAWSLALSGVAREEAEQAIAISFLTSQPTPTAEDGISRHH